MDPGRYAMLEDEQRFVLDRLSPKASSPRLIEDRYVTGTTMRLRHVTDDTSEVFKLGHKACPDGRRPSTVWHTTIYLSRTEHDLLSTLPAAELAKRRYSMADGGSCDVFLGLLDGLVMFEADRPATPPAGVAVEVTDDVAFTGGSLASLDPVAATALVERARRLVAGARR